MVAAVLAQRGRHRLPRHRLSLGEAASADQQVHERAAAIDVRNVGRRPAAYEVLARRRLEEFLDPGDGIAHAGLGLVVVAERQVERRPGHHHLAFPDAAEDAERTAALPVARLREKRVRRAEIAARGDLVAGVGEVEGEHGERSEQPALLRAGIVHDLFADRDEVPQAARQSRDDPEMHQDVVEVETAGARNAKRGLGICLGLWDEAEVEGGLGADEIRLGPGHRVADRYFGFYGRAQCRNLRRVGLVAVQQCRDVVDRARRRREGRSLELRRDPFRLLQGNGRLFGLAGGHEKGNRGGGEEAERHGRFSRTCLLRLW